MGGGPFVGRAGELARLRELLAGVTAGVGGVVMIEGEQGIGKSSLLREALAGAEAAGCRVGWGTADEIGQRLPLRLILECLGEEGRLAAGGGEAGGSLAPGGAAAVLSGDPVLGATERLLALVDRLCAISPVVLVAEDLQWADEASLRVWQRLAGVVDQVPLLLAGTCRRIPAREELTAFRRSVLVRGGAVISLAPLPAAEVSTLTGQVIGGRPGPRLTRLVRRAGGNPLYVRELADALVREDGVKVARGVAELTGEPATMRVPVSLAAAIEERLSSLSAEAVSVLRWAAVLGHEFPVTDLEVVTGRMASELMGALDEAVVAAVVAEAGSRLAFRHGLIRQALYEAMPAALRTALHRQAARALADAGMPPERVAEQLMLEPESPDAWVLDWLAGTVWSLIYRAPSLATELLRAVLDGAPPDGDPRLEVLCAALVTAEFRQSHYAEVELVGGKLLGRVRDPVRAAEVSWLVAYAQLRMNQYAAAAATVSQTLTRLGTAQAGIWGPRLHVLRAITMAACGEPDKAAEVATAELANARKTGDRFAAGYAAHCLVYVHLYHRDADAVLANLEEGLAAIGDGPQTSDLRLVMLSNRIDALLRLDRLAEADTAIAETLQLAERAGTPQMSGIFLIAAEYHFQVGQWDAALTGLETAAGLPSASYNRLRAHGLTALIAMHRDHQDMARANIDAVQDEEISSPMYRTVGCYLLLARALAHWRAGRQQAALAVLAQGIDPGNAQEMWDRYMVLPTLARLALAAGDAATAAAAARVAGQEAQRERLPPKAAAAAHCRGLVAGDAAPLMAAAAYYESTGRLLDRGQALEDAAVVLAGQGDLTAARRAFGDAVGVYRGLGAEWDIRCAATRLRPYGVRRTWREQRPRPLTGWAALTPAETKIAHLIAEGRSNPDIAAELFLSRNTVQTHVSHILSKLGARSRAEIVREAVRHAPGGHPDSLSSSA